MSRNRLSRTAAAAALGLLLVLTAAACGSDGDSATPATSATTERTGAGATAPTAAPSVPGGSAPMTRVPVQGFGEVAYRIQSMPAAQRCALLAETSAQHARGLMNRRDLSGYDGMLFVFSEDTTSRFYMLNTPLPLSIAWFDAGGRFVSSADMEPCIDRADCPLYAAAGPYRYALEVPQGGLTALGIGPGSMITIGGACA